MKNRIAIATMTTAALCVGGIAPAVAQSSTPTNSLTSTVTSSASATSPAAPKSTQPDEKATGEQSNSTEATPPTSPTKTSATGPMSHLANAVMSDEFQTAATILGAVFTLFAAVIQTTAVVVAASPQLQQQMHDLLYRYVQ